MLFEHIWVLDTSNYENQLNVGDEIRQYLRDHHHKTELVFFVFLLLFQKIQALKVDYGLEIFVNLFAPLLPLLEAQRFYQLGYHQ